MSFLDDFGKKMTDAGQRAVQKTQEMSEVSRIKSLISQNESKINNTCYQIGKLYISIHGEDCEEDFKGMVTMVKELEQQNLEYQKQIQEVRGVQRCPTCGAEVSRGVAFCSSCGTAMPQIESKEILDDCVKCTKCGASVKKGMRFCTSCGQALTTQTDNQAATENAGDVPVKICSQCGAKIKVVEDLLFCTECGAKL